LYSYAYFFFDNALEVLKNALPPHLEWHTTLGLFLGHSNIFVATTAILFFLQHTKQVIQDKQVRQGIDIYQTFIFLNGVAHLSSVIVSYTYDFYLEVALTLATGLYATYVATKTNSLLRYLQTFVSPHYLATIRAEYDKQLDKRIELQFSVLENLQQRFLYYISHNPIPALIINQNLIVEQYSDSYLEYFSLEAEQVRGKKIEEVHKIVLFGYPKLLEQIVFAIENNVLVDQGDFIALFQCEIDIRYKIVPVRNVKNKCIGAIFYFQELERHGKQ
jgi:hypothetical protein